MRRRTSRGFTLIEVIIVVAIIAILVVLSVPGLQRSRSAAYEAQAVAGLKSLRAAAELYYRDRGYYPPMDPAFSTDYWDELQGYLPPEVKLAGPTDAMAKNYELRARTDTYPSAVTDSLGRIVGSHLFTIGAFPTNPELRLRTFYIEEAGTVTVNSAFENY